MEMNKQGELAPNASENLQTKELRHKINAAINALPEQCRLVYKLSRFENLKYKEISNVLNISIKTLWNYGQEGYGDGSNKEYLQAIQHAREKCISYATKRLYDKDGVNGAKFYLTNNAERMGGLRYADRQEVSVDAAPITFKDFPD